MTGTLDDRNYFGDIWIAARWTLISLSNCDLLKIKYHVKTCHTRYKRSGERHTQMQNSSKREATTDCPPTSPTSGQKRDKTRANSSPKEKPCIIYDQIKCQGEVPHLRGVCSKIVTQSS